jgi:hypothetical protein
MSATRSARYARSSDSRIRLLGFSYFGDNRSDEVHFSVKGTTSTYEVAWEFDGEKSLYRCTCPDHSNRGSRCKHIYFCFSRVLQLHPERLDGATTVDIIAAIAKYVGKRRGLTSQESIQRRKIEPDDECPICFEVLAGEETVWCINSCKNNFHRKCMDTWLKETDATCPLCRAEWDTIQ